MEINSENIILNEQQQQAFDLVKDSNFSFFLTGRAGTGKTTLLRIIQNTVDKSFVVVSKTGVAAMLANGKTINSFFGMPLMPINRRTEFQLSSDKRLMLRQVDTIIVDEVSMVPCDMIDGIDRILREVMHSSQPFGGKQIIFSGDMYQLDPVVRKSDTGVVKFYKEEYGVELPYFYFAHVFDRLKLPRIELTEVYRQKDARFLALLDNVRAGRCQSTDLMILNSIGTRNYAANGVDTLILSTKNDQVDAINASRLNAIEKELFTYEATLDGEVTPENKKNILAPEVLMLKEGARVMFCRNDRAGRWVNGTLGTVTSLSDYEIMVQVDNGDEVSVDKVTWEIPDYQYNEETKTLESNLVGTFTQYPLRAAWAITVHKSQGMTFEKVNIDCNAGFFTAGQLYVALSRAKSLEGLGLSCAITWRDIRRKPAIDAFMAEYSDVDQIRTDMQMYQSYNKAMLEADMDSAAQECLRLMHIAIADHRQEDAYFAAEKLLDSLYDSDILHAEEKQTLLPGDDNHTLLLNTIIAVENGNYPIAVALADRGILVDGAPNFFYLKVIALLKAQQTAEAEAVCEEWLKSLNEKNESIDSRCRYAIARCCYQLGKSYMTDMQSFIRHNQLYLPGYEMLRTMMRRNEEKLQTESLNRNLVDVFNSKDGSLKTAWRNSSPQARRALVDAILEYPYEQ